MSSFQSAEKIITAPTSSVKEMAMKFEKDKVFGLMNLMINYRSLKEKK